MATAAPLPVKHQAAGVRPVAACFTSAQSVHQEFEAGKRNFVRMAALSPLQNMIYDRILEVLFFNEATARLPRQRARCRKQQPCRPLLLWFWSLAFSERLEAFAQRSAGKCLSLLQYPRQIVRPLTFAACGTLIQSGQNIDGCVRV